MRRILMQIATFSTQITQKQAPSQCYSMPINDISGLLWSDILLVHMVCLKCMWGTGKWWLRAISWPCTQSSETWEITASEPLFAQYLVDRGWLWLIVVANCGTSYMGCMLFGIHASGVKIHHGYSSYLVSPTHSHEPCAYKEFAIRRTMYDG